MSRPNVLEFYEVLPWSTNSAGTCRWRLVAPNGRIIGASSEAFANANMAQKNAVLNYYDGLRCNRIIVTNVRDDEGTHRWVLRMAAARLAADRRA